MAEQKVVIRRSVGRVQEDAPARVVTDSAKVARLLALAEAIPRDQEANGICKSWAKDVVILQVELPQPTGIFTKGRIEMWRHLMRHPGYDHMEFMSGNEVAELHEFITSLWEKAEKV